MKLWKRNIIYWLVLLGALIMATILLLPLWLIGSIISYDTAKYQYKVAYGIDQLGNVVGAPVFNIILIKKNGYKFGNPDETISSVLGKNYRDNTLRDLGFIISHLLGVDKLHVIKSIEEDEKN
jgi:hypothetical protein